jgi:hypothetical protein
MNNKKEYPIREDWEEYYKTLEAIRRTGKVNMCGAGIYLKECYPKELTEQQANDILVNWINNYKALNEKYGWQ